MWWTWDWVELVSLSLITEGQSATHSWARSASLPGVCFWGLTQLNGSAMLASLHHLRPPHVGGGLPVAAGPYPEALGVVVELRGGGWSGLGVVGGLGVGCLFGLTGLRLFSGGLALAACRTTPPRGSLPQPQLPGAPVTQQGPTLELGHAQGVLGVSFLFNAPA